MNRSRKKREPQQKEPISPQSKSSNLLSSQKAEITKQNPEIQETLSFLPSDGYKKLFSAFQQVGDNPDLSKQLFEDYGKGVWEIHTFNLNTFVKDGGIDENVAAMMGQILQGWAMYFFVLGFFTKEQEILELLNQPVKEIKEN